MNQDFLNLALQRKKIKNIITEDDYHDLSIQEFASKMWYVCDPCLYGKAWENKIKYDSKGILKTTQSKENRGEFVLGNRYGEIKTSYINKNGSYRIANIRDWEKYDLFLINLIDENFVPKFYLLPKDNILNNFHTHFMDNNKDLNLHNSYANKGIHIKVDELNVLEKFNLLRGDSYMDLIDYILYVGNKTSINHFIRPVNSVVNSPVNFVVNKSINTNLKRKPMTKISILLHGVLIIKGKNNSEVMTNLVKELGPKTCDGIIWESQLSKEPSERRFIKLDDGYYFNPRFSLRDIETNINNLVKKTGYHILIRKEK
jgi:hypothetical protein